MANATAITLPEFKDILAAGSGFAAGFFIPNMVIDIVSNIDESPYASNMSDALAGFYSVSRFGKLATPRLIVFLGSLALMFYSIRYFGTILSKVGGGFVVGVAVRYIVLPYLGINAPLVSSNANTTASNVSVDLL